MNSQITEDFVACFGRLPEAVKAQARKAYRLWRDNPAHPSLFFKRIHGHESLYAVRVSRGWRTLGLLEGDTMTWFWIGSHAEYRSACPGVIFTHYETSQGRCPRQSVPFRRPASSS